MSDSRTPCSVQRSFSELKTRPFTVAIAAGRSEVNCAYKVHRTMIRRD